MPKRPLQALLLACATAVAASVQAEAETTLTWHGHATFEIVTPKGTVLWVDPWLNNPKNPRAADDKDPLEEVTRGDYILLTHAHFDHIADAAAIGTKTGAQLVTNFDLGRQMVQIQGYPEEQAGMGTMMNIGGEIEVADGEVRIAMVNAVHSSGMGNPYTGEEDPSVLYGGNPAGFVIQIQDGPTIYHSGDTAYFRDMEWIGEQYEIDVALLAIGGRFTMHAQPAAQAAQALGARLAIPQHFGTFPVLAPDATGFTTTLDGLGIAYHVMEPGDTVQFEGKDLKR
jgi:L-ascorbate metabolism protein UlaG (beta-lactamase superfamily)